MKQKNWFKPKAYCHLTKRLNQKDGAWIKNYVSNPENIIKHKFYPLIHRTLAAPRFKDGVDRLGNKVRRHYTIKNDKRTSNVKYREIYYSNHLDAHIYSYYTQKILEPLYEAELKKCSLLNNSILAYRRIPVNDKSRCKCNIDFADEAFEMIKNSQGEIAVLALDISRFFDSLNHKQLKRTWTQLLGKTALPDDHFKIYKSLTQFSYVELKDLLQEFNYKHPNEIVQNDTTYFFEDGKEFRQKVKEKGYIKRNSFRSIKEKDIKEVVGIPQGTPMSAFLANLYLLDFDKLVIEKLKEYDGVGIYQRYSDDILIICPKQSYEEMEAFLYKNIEDFNLVIQPTKTQRSFFTNGKLEKKQESLIYLGFQYDGNRKLIKSASLAKFYRKMKSSVKFRAYKAYVAKQKLERGKLVNAALHRKKLYQQFSFLGASKTDFKKRNYFSYAHFAARRMKSHEINNQLSKAWSILHKEISKQEKNYDLPKIKISRNKKLSIIS